MLIKVVSANTPVQNFYINPDFIVQLSRFRYDNKHIGSWVEMSRGDPVICKESPEEILEKISLFK